MEKKIMTKITLAAIAACMMTVSAGGIKSKAADLAASEPPVEAAVAETPWSGELAIYGLLPWLDGDAGVNDLGPVSFSLTPSEIINALDFTIQASGEINYERFGLFADLIYFKISGSEASQLGPLVVDANLSVAMTAGTLAGSYAFYEDETATIKALAGARYWAVDTNFNLAIAPIGGVSASKVIQWWDPVIGLKAKKQLTEKVFITATGFIGGFGAGSDFMWDVFGGIGYEFNDHVAIAAGYRGLGADYSDRGDLVDLTAQGPLIGVGFKF
ncbi:hypothetical protein AAFN47_01675 [Hoeflea sp. CAU 1731]